MYTNLKHLNINYKMKRIIRCYMQMIFDKMVEIPTK